MKYSLYVQISALKRNLLYLCSAVHEGLYSVVGLGSFVHGFKFVVYMCT